MESELLRRRKTFPPFVIKKAKITGGEISRKTQVFNHPNVDDILRLQIRGGIRTPEKAENLLIRTDRSKWGRSFTQNQRGRQYVSEDGRRIYRKFARKDDKVVAFLRKQASVPKRYNIAKPVRDIEKKIPFFGNLYLRSEIKKWEDKLK